MQGNDYPEPQPMDLSDVPEEDLEALFQATRDFLGGNEEEE